MSTTAASISTMRAAVLVAPRRVEIREVPAPLPGPGQVRVRIEGCGLSPSELTAWRGSPPSTLPFEPGAPGREGWGVVDAAGPGRTALDDGDRVAVISRCALAEQVVVDADAVVKLPSSLRGYPFPGRSLGGAVNVLRRCDLHPGQTVAVVGAGFLGLLLIQLMAAAGLRIFAIARREFSLRLARRYGACEAISLDDDARVIVLVRRLTDGRGCERVVETAGAARCLDRNSSAECREMTRAGAQ